jgi:hypothetical protein
MAPQSPVLPHAALQIRTAVTMSNCAFWDTKLFDAVKAIQISGVTTALISMAEWLYRIMATIFHRKVQYLLQNYIDSNSNR